MHSGLVSVLPCGGTSCFGCIAFPLAFLSSCQKCPKHWSVSCTCVLEAMNCYVVLQKHSIGNKKKKKESLVSGINFRGTKWSIIGLLTFTRYFFLTCVFFFLLFFLVSLRVVGVCFCNMSLCACVVIRFFFFFIGLFYKSLWQDCDTHFYFWNCRGQAFPQLTSLYLHVVCQYYYYTIWILYYCILYITQWGLFSGERAVFLPMFVLAGSLIFCFIFVSFSEERAVCGVHRTCLSSTWWGWWDKAFYLFSPFPCWYFYKPYFFFCIIFLGK